MNCTESIPSKISIVEVGPRDGFQNVKTWIPTDVKLAVIDKLITAGFKRIEITSFVSPKAIPQMSDAENIAAEIVSRYRDSRLELIALVPNLVGAKRAHSAGIHTQTFVVSVSELHNYENTKMSVEQSLSELNKIKTNLPQIKMRAALATAFGCPFKGDIPIDDILRLIEQALQAGAAEVLLCDTIGIANPRLVEKVILEVARRYPLDNMCLHLHDTRGMGLANVITAMQNGIFNFETAIGGLGGCPFAPGAAGNIATEDLLNMCNEMGLETGIDIHKVLDTATLIKTSIQNNLTSHMANICALGNQKK